MPDGDKEQPGTGVPNWLRFVLTLVAAVVVLISISVTSFALFSDYGSTQAEGEPPTTEPAATATTSASSSNPTTITVAATTTSTSTSSTTTTLPPGVTVELAGAPPELVAMIDSLYTWVGGGQEAPPMPEALAQHLTGAAVFSELALEGEAALAEIEELGTVAVAVFGDDVVLAVDEGAGWEIVGAKLASLDKDAWYGDPVRMVMAIGSDARPGENQQRLRADSLHLLSTVPGAAGGAIVGFPRDSWVATPYGTEDKFAHVMAGKGPEMVLETARNLTGLPIEGYFVTGFKGFQGMVDDFGGVEVDIPFGMSDEASQAYFREGLQKLNGATALAFSRNRHIGGGDLTRSRHQGLVIKAGLTASQSVGVLSVPRLLTILLDNVWTDLDAGDLLTLAAAAYEMDPDLVVNLVVPASLGRVGSKSVVFLGDGAEAVFRDLDDDGLITPEPED
jgi:LCP family protein required for cell wall assembly